MAKTGPAAFLKAFCEGACRNLTHKHCGSKRCPCEAARTWLRTLPKTMPLDKSWEACPEAEWLVWVCEKLGIATRGHETCAAIRAAVPWSSVVEAMENPPTTAACEDCGDVEEIDDLRDGRCESCDGNYEYCSICDDRLHEDSLCDHLQWSDVAGCTCGTGSDNPKDHHESFYRLLTSIGLRHARSLRVLIADGSYFKWNQDRRLEESLDELREHARDSDDDATEVGMIWLDTLGGTDRLRPSVDMTLEWIDQHIAAREAVIAADDRPMRVIRDGSGRYFVRGEWAALREQGAWMPQRQANDLKRRLKAIYQAAGIKVVHVLTAAPAFETGDKR